MTNAPSVVSITFGYLGVAAAFEPMSGTTNCVLPQQEASNLLWKHHTIAYNANFTMRDELMQKLEMQKACHTK